MVKKLIDVVKEIEKKLNNNFIEHKESIEKLIEIVKEVIEHEISLDEECDKDKLRENEYDDESDEDSGLKCKIFHSTDIIELHCELNKFLSNLKSFCLIKNITQSESKFGLTITIFYIG